MEIPFPILVLIVTSLWCECGFLTLFLEINRLQKERGESMKEMMETDAVFNPVLTKLCYWAVFILIVISGFAGLIIWMGLQILPKGRIS